LLSLTKRGVFTRNSRERRSNQVAGRR
jgi:hypothetical protein